MTESAPRDAGWTTRAGVTRQEPESRGFERRREVAADLDEEKEIGLGGLDDEDSNDDDILHDEERPDADTIHRTKHLQAVPSHRSYAGSDGYTCFSDKQDDRPNIPSGDTAADSAQQFLVTFDGDTDPENPRSMSKLRRWMIVIIVAGSSICV